MGKIKKLLRTLGLLAIPVFAIGGIILYKKNKKVAEQVDKFIK
jgi:hypothetical protein